ncbi:NAD(P)-dependent oxidoreductase [Phototrophicus methaneseepsis]|uniref:NAD(P)-dependent oxidoreductase n=1 Tax=Phototrophicus methaneseepsis TaxID=2710758 RepID=A0A7S8E8N0_9CHLR|nr:NAD(P)-dependent oxidoreductase [Phototrophicus methaneseepsis]QPC82401.1 NAD(P)-dependent oxidoreductase [Phototrophicus methaneseepsis]
MTTVLVTGSSGKVGRACVKDLLEHGYDVVCADVVPPREDQGCPFTQVELSDFGQTLQAVAGIDDRYAGVDAIVHLAAIPAPGRSANSVIFENNILSTYNIFESARVLGIKNVVWASSETVLGLPFETPPPYAPVDEDYPGRPESAYSLSKLLGEEMAKQYCRWEPDMKIIGLRFSNVMEPQDYAAFPSFDSDAMKRKWNLWAYIDARDAAQGIRKALEYQGTGADVFIIANADSVMSRPNADLMAEVFPDVPMKKEVGAHETLLSIDKARRILGYEPAYSWRDEV